MPGACSTRCSSSSPHKSADPQSRHRTKSAQERQGTQGLLGVSHSWPVRFKNASHQALLQMQGTRQQGLPSEYERRVVAAKEDEGGAATTRDESVTRASRLLRLVAKIFRDPEYLRSQCPFGTRAEHDGSPVTTISARKKPTSVDRLINTTLAFVLSNSGLHFQGIRYEWRPFLKEEKKV